MGILAIASASAADLNETIILEEDSSSLVEENLGFNEDNLMDESLDNEKLSVDDDSNVLSINYTPKTFDEIQTTVDNASDGDTIILDGYYQFNNTVRIGKQLNFIGINNATVDGLSKVKLFDVWVKVSFKDITFKNAKSDGWGGAIQGGLVTNCTFINNTAHQGGAIYVCDAFNCTFINNSADEGGAIYGLYYDSSYVAHSSIVENCTFLGNNAQKGGAIYNANVFNSSFKDNSADEEGGAMREGTATNCTFINNYADKGGALFSSRVYNSKFISNFGVLGGIAIRESTAWNCTFINHTDTAVFQSNVYNSIFINNSIVYDSAAGGAMRYGSAVNCTFINNFAIGTYLNTGGGALNSVSAVNCTFINNYATFGGAMLDGSAENCTFINNYATREGGAIFRCSAVNCTFINNSANNGGAMKGRSAVDCTFINNSASASGGAISSASNVENCIFINNSALNGGAIYGIYSTGMPYSYHYFNSLVINCTFVNNSASNGGALYAGNVIYCTLANNSADYGGAIYRGVNNLENEANITNCEFIGCFANNQGGAIYLNEGANITYSTFNECTSGDNTCMAVNSSQLDYLIQDCIFDVYPDNIDYHFVSTLIADNLTYFNGEEGTLIISLSEFRGVLSQKTVYLILNDKKYNTTTNSSGMAKFNIENYINIAGIYNATVSYEGDSIINPSSVNITVTINKHDSILNVPELVIYKNEYGVLIGNLNNIRGPLSNKTIIFTYDGENYRRTTDQNGVVEFNVLNYLDGKGKFDLNVTFEGDDCNYPSSTNVSVYIIDFRGILTCSVDGKYFNDTILVFSLINYKNNKPIFDAPIKLIFSNGAIINLTTDVDGSASYRMPFKPGTYGVNAYVDQEYVDVNNISISNIEINKIIGQISHELLNGNKTLMFKLYNAYNLDVFRNVKIKLAFNNGETAEIITNDDGIAMYDIPFPKGTYSVSVRVEGEYKQFEEDYINNIVISNDLNCSINFTNNISFAFGEFGSTDFTVDGGIVELDHIKVVDHPEALISLSNTTITVFGLSVGKYVLEVETIPDDYHNPVIGRVNIIVTNAPSKVTFSAGIVFEYGSSSSIHVIVEGGKVERKNIKIVGHPEANIQLKGQIITVSGLTVGNYNLQVTSTPDSDHTASTATVKVTVKKATAVIKASKITVAYKKGGQWVIKFMDSKSKKAISNMKVTLKVYTGKKYKTVSLKTNSKGETTYQTKKLSKGNHKVVVSAKDSRYNFNSYSSSIKVVKQTAVKFKVKKKTAKDGAALSITVMNKKTKKGINGVKIKLLIYTGKKYKTVTLKSMKKGKYVGVCGYATNKLSVGKHKVKIMPADIKYGGSAKSVMKITKKHKKIPAWETKDSAK